MDFDRAIQSLCDAKVEFVLLGGVCAILHGSANVTFDLDICFSRTRSNARRLAASLAPYHPRLRNLPEGLPFIWDEATIRNGTVFTLVTDLGEIDLLSEVAGVGGYDEAKANSVETEAFGRRFFMLNLKSLIRAKLAAGRTKDMNVVPELESLLDAQKDE